MFSELLIEISRFIFPIVSIIIILLSIHNYRNNNDNIYSILIQQILIVLTFILGMSILYFSDIYIEDLEILKGVIFMYLPFLLAFFVIMDTVLRKCNLTMFNIIIFLISIGIITLSRLEPALASQQIIWIFISIGVLLFALIMFKIPIKYQSLGILYAISGFIFLLLPFFYGKTIYGATNWVIIRNFSFQPSEFVKIILVFFLAALYKKDLKLKNLIYGGSIVALYIIVLVLQRDLGGALIYLFIFLIMTYVYTKRDSFLLLGLLGSSVAAYISHYLFSHVQVRVESWLYPWENISTSGYQIAQSLFAITGGGWFGTGFSVGIPQYIPIVTTDFIFSAICEELGVIVGICIILLYYIMFLMIMRAYDFKNKFYSLLIIGFGTLISFQVFLIIGGVIKLIPLTGVTLPFVSYGGSSILSYSIIIAIIQSVIIRSKKSGDKK